MSVHSPVSYPVFRAVHEGLGHQRVAEAITSAPDKVTGVYPADGAVNLQLDAVITWARPARAQWYDVWIGATAETLEKDENSPQLARSFNPTLALDSTYFIRIDAGNIIGTTTGDVTSFSTWASADIQLDEPGLNPVTDDQGNYIDTRTPA